MNDLTDAELAAVEMDPRIGVKTGALVDRLVAEVRRRRRQVDIDLRAHVDNVALIGSLQRRIAVLRLGLKELGAERDLEADDTRRRRFQKKQRGRRG